MPSNCPWLGDGAPHHLELIQQLDLSPAKPTAEAVDSCERLIGLIIGLIRSLLRGS